MKKLAIILAAFGAFSFAAPTPTEAGPPVWIVRVTCSNTSSATFYGYPMSDMGYIMQVGKAWCDGFGAGVHISGVELIR